MKKHLLFLLLATPMLSFALNNTIDMSNLKCGNYQVYSNTTIKDLKDNCNLKKAGMITRGDNLNIPKDYFNVDDKLYEVQFNSTSQEGLISCDFNYESATSTVQGCRNTY